MKISIITACYNSSSTLSDAINSVRNQSYSDIEYIIIDGGSADGSVEIIKKNSEYISKWISEPDKGIYNAINKGIKLASGNVIGLLHSDDLLADNLIIERIAKAFINSGADVLYGDLIYVSKSDTGKVFRYWKAGKYNKKKLLYGWMPPHPTFFVKKEIYDKIGGFDEKFKIAADYEFILRTLNYIKTQVVYIPEVITKMRIGGASNKSLSNIILKSREDYFALKQNNFSFPFVALIFKNLRKISQFFVKS